MFSFGVRAAIEHTLGCQVIQWDHYEMEAYWPARFAHQLVVQMNLAILDCFTCALLLLQRERVGRALKAALSSGRAPGRIASVILPSQMIVINIILQEDYWISDGANLVHYLFCNKLGERVPIESIDVDINGPTSWSSGNFTSSTGFTLLTAI